MEQNKPRARPGFRRTNRATRWAGALLCWAHALALALTATEILLRPSAAWWSTARIASWVLTGVLLAAWVLLRIAQKRLLRQVDGPDRADDGPCYDDGPGCADDGPDCADRCGDSPDGGGAEDYGRAA
ncbi:hypothetical protein ACIOD0_19845 [Kitasatospora albolonga]